VSNLSPMYKNKPQKIKVRSSNLEKLARLIALIILAGAGQNQVDRPENVSHEIQNKVSARTEIFIGA